MRRAGCRMSRGQTARSAPDQVAAIVLALLQDAGHRLEGFEPLRSRHCETLRRHEKSMPLRLRLQGID